MPGQVVSDARGGGQERRDRASVIPGQRVGNAGDGRQPFPGCPSVMRDQVVGVAAIHVGDTRGDRRQTAGSASAMPGASVSAAGAGRR
jgi:hypothetical protein